MEHRGKVKLQTEADASQGGWTVGFVYYPETGDHLVNSSNPGSHQAHNGCKDGRTVEGD